MATVILLNVFVGNIVSIHKQIEKLPDVIKVNAFISNLNGSQAAGLKIKEKYVDGVALKMNGKEIFDQRYSAGVVYSEANDIEQPVVNGDVFITVVSFSGLLGFTLLVSGISAWRNLREEPLALLSGNEQG